MTKPVAHFSSLLDRAALEHLQAKTLLPSFSHYDVWLYEHAVGFTVAKMMDADLLAETKAALTHAMQSGEPYHKFVQRLKPYLMARGWWGEQVMTDPVDGIQKTVQLGSTRRLRVIFQTNMATAYAAGQWARIEEDKRKFPYLKYIASTAEQKRASHTRFYGKIWRVDDPIWQSIFPPNGYGCQCTVRQLTAKQALIERGEDLDKQPERFTEQQKANHDKGVIDDGTDWIEWRTFINPRTGQAVQVPFDVLPSFAHNHAKRVEQMIDVISDRHGQVLATEIQQSTHHYINQKISRPNFDNLDFKPNLTALNQDVDNAQQLIYQFAGSGYQIGRVEIGKPLSYEYFEHGGQYYLLDYADNGVSLFKMPKSKIESFKLNGINNIINELSSDSDRNFLSNKLPEIAEMKFGSTDLADRLAGYLYSTNGGYLKTNPELIRVKRDLSLIDDITLQTIRSIDEFLEKAPKYVGTTTRKLNSSRMPNADNFINAHSEKSLIRYSNFTSTSKPDGDLGVNADILLTIHGKSGVDISALSRYESEGEVLMPRHAVYRVKSHKEKQGKYFIELEEVDINQYNQEKIIQLTLLSG